MTEAEFLAAVSTGYGAVSPDADLVCLGEMGIGNTTAAAALAAGLFGGGGARWAGRGTGVDDAGLKRKQSVIDAGLARHAALLDDPLQVAMALGGRELAAMLGATLAARRHGIPVCWTGLSAPPPRRRWPCCGRMRSTMRFWRMSPPSPGIAAWPRRSVCVPLLDLGMRLGEASGATLAVPLLRAALACHSGMATFAEAAVDNRA